MTTKSHRKPRPTFVCVACKARKIKCDRGRPACKKCRDAGRECIYGAVFPKIDGDGSTLFETNQPEVNPGKQAVPTINEATALSNVSQPSDIDRLNSQKYPAIHPPSNLSPSTAVSSPSIVDCSRGSIWPSTGSFSRSSHSARERSNHYITPATSTDMSLPSVNSPKANFLKVGSVSDFDVEDINMRLWDPNIMYVQFNPLGFADLPFSLHSFAQSDTYLRVLCATLHGDTILEIHARLKLVSEGCTSIPPEAMKSLVEDKGTPSTVQQDKFSMPENGKKKNPRLLKFLEPAIVRAIEERNNESAVTFPLVCSSPVGPISDVPDPRLLATLHKYVREVESTLPERQVVDYLLKKFYETIYPLFPLIDIPTFETRLQTVLVNPISGRYEINVFNQAVRNKMETLIIFLLLLVAALKIPRSPPDIPLNMSSRDSKNLANSLLRLAQMLLSLFDIHKSPNENIFCAHLLLYIVGYLDPDTSDYDNSYDRVGLMRTLNAVAETMGLQFNPTRIKRLCVDSSVGTSVINFRYRLWVVLQALNLQFLTSTGGTTQTNTDFLQMFLERDGYTLPALGSDLHFDSEVDRRIFSIQDDKYQFHIILSQLMLCVNSLTREQNLYTILERVGSVLDFLHQRFPIAKLGPPYDTTNMHTLTEKNWRDSAVDLGCVEAIEILNMNILGLSSILSIYTRLLFHFEGSSMMDLQENRVYYHKFFLESVDLYLQLVGLIVNYLTGKFSAAVSKRYEYYVDKYVSVQLIKLWLFQTSYITRLCYKKKILELQEKSNLTRLHAPPNDSTGENIQLLCSLIGHLRKQMQVLVDVCSNILREKYLNCFQALFCVKYILYITEQGELVDFINGFWNRAFHHQEIPDRILGALNLKWGLDAKGSNFIDKQLMNPLTLSNLDSELLRKLDYIFGGTFFYSQPSLNTLLSTIPLSQTNEDTLNQSIESNFDLFLNIINEELGFLPEI